MPKSNIIPLAANIVLETIKEKEEQTKSGIIIPDSANDKKPPVIAKVVAVGTNVEVLEPDDMVIFSEYGFDPIKFEDRELLVGPAEKVLAIIKK